MLVIRMQRSGRKGHAMFRVIVQDSRRTPTSGKLVAQLGSYDPHAKTIILDNKKTEFYLSHGAQPSERVVRILTQEGVKLPKWVSSAAPKQRVVRNADKRRSTRPEEPVAEEEAPVVEAPAAEPEAEATPVAEETAPVAEEAAAEPAEEKTEEVAAEETPKTSEKTEELASEAEAEEAPVESVAEPTEEEKPKEA
jgi:small subunit ribosomal protein S16